LLLAFTQEACDKYAKDLKDSGILLVDSNYVLKVPQGKYKIVSLPITELAEKETGKSLVANILSLGVIIELTKVISPESMESAILSRVPKGTEDLNIKAFRAGIKAAQQIKH